MNRQQNILIVDDKEENLFALEQTLQPCGARLVRALSGNDALAATLDHEFALAILDVRMPGMDGFELADLLRGDPHLKHLPIIFLTAEFSEDSIVFRGYEAGAVDFLVKPFNPKILLSKVGVFLELDWQRQELNRHKLLLEAANRELETFSYSVSHDLRAPLRRMDGFSKALLQGYADLLDEEGLHYLERVRVGAQQMGVLIDDLLSLSRISRSEMHRGSVDLSVLVREVCDELSSAEPERKAEFVIRDGVVADADSHLMGVVFRNLLGNAWKFTGKKEEGAKIEFLSAANAQCGDPNPSLSDRAPVFMVRDNGVGFEMAFADKLFGAFQRLHRADEFEGTGIGLATVQRVIHRHGGTIWAKGTPGVGACFFFTLG